MHVAKLDEPMDNTLIAKHYRESHDITILRENIKHVEFYRNGSTEYKECNYVYNGDTIAVLDGADVGDCTVRFITCASCSGIIQ